MQRPFFMVALCSFWALPATPLRENRNNIGWFSLIFDSSPSSRGIFRASLITLFLTGGVSYCDEKTDNVTPSGLDVVDVFGYNHTTPSGFGGISTHHANGMQRSRRTNKSRRDDIIIET